ncbi:MAG: lamin tail domain-containing protein [Limisphaerales bacterium]
MKKNLTRPFLALTIVGGLLPLAAQAQLRITEVSSTGSGNSTYQHDWFELRNDGPLSLDITGWRVDDDSALFSSALTLRGVTSIAPGQVVIFMESNTSGTSDAANGAAFESAWFGSNIPAGFTLGFYGGSGIGLSSTSDAVNIYDSTGVLQAGVTFGLATTGVSFDNAAGLSGEISLLSAVGVNGAFNSVTGSEIGSPGIAPVPEPSVIALAGLGLVSLLGLRRLKNRQA